MARLGPGADPRRGNPQPQVAHGADPSKCILVSGAHLPVFRTACIGAVFYVLLLVLTVVLLYFDFRGAVLLVSVFFLVSNAGFTWITLSMPEDTWGLGYLASTALSLLLCIVLLWNRLKNLEFVTFVRQPINQQKVVVR